MGTAGTDLENTLKRVGDLDTVANYYVPHMYADNLDGQLAAALAARVHTDAALAAPHGRGLVASDVIAQLPAVLDAAI